MKRYFLSKELQPQLVKMVEYVMEPKRIDGMMKARNEHPDARGWTGLVQMENGEAARFAIVVDGDTNERIENYINHAKPLIATETGWQLIIFGWCEACDDCAQNIALLSLTQFFAELVGEKNRIFKNGGKVIVLARLEEVIDATMQRLKAKLN